MVRFWSLGTNHSSNEPQELLLSEPCFLQKRRWCVELKNQKNPRKPQKKKQWFFFCGSFETQRCCSSCFSKNPKNRCFLLFLWVLQELLWKALSRRIPRIPEKNRSVLLFETTENSGSWGEKRTAPLLEQKKRTPLVLFFFKCYPLLLLVLLFADSFETSRTAKEKPLFSVVNLSKRRTPRTAASFSWGKSFRNEPFVSKKLSVLFKTKVFLTTLLKLTKKHLFPKHKLFSSTN